MSSKMREALTEAITEILRIDSTKRSQGSWATERDVPYIIDQIISRYGDLEFTREEVWRMLWELAHEVVLDGIPVRPFADRILSRHLGESSEQTHGPAQCPNPRCQSFGCAKCDETPTIKASEIDAEHNPEIPWPDPKSSDLIAEDFNLIWGCIKSWDINVPEAYKGYCGATGNHVMQILFALGWRDITDYWENGGSIPEPQHTLDREVGEIQGELIELTKRVAAIERRVLADGHSENCKLSDPNRTIIRFYGNCTCGHDEIWEQTK